MQPIEVFFSYSHRDEPMRDQLGTQLTILKRQRIIFGWYERKITSGEEWDRKINEHLETSPLILLLVSPDFVASEYCYAEEVHRAMKRHEAGEATVIPVILRPVDWSSAPFGHLPALPKDALPVTSWPNQDEAFVDVAKGIRKAIDNIVDVRRSNLEQYEQAFAAAVQQTYPITAEGRTMLQQLQHRLLLKEDDILPIEERSTTPIRESRRKALQIYEGAAFSATQHESPLQDTTLRRLQEFLRLSDADVAPIHARATLPPSHALPEDDLSSNHGIQYEKLRDLLKTGKWKDADRETYRVMLAAVGKEEGNWISSQDMETFDCVDLHTIDQLWVKYSDKRFGFSVQRQIWEDLGAKAGKYDQEHYKEFGDRVGWRVNNEWRPYNNLTFDLSARQGHLPAWYGGLIVASLFSRAKACKI